MATKKFHFDYNDLTDFERRWARPFFPFYTWFRKNSVLQVDQLVHKPYKYQAVGDLINLAQRSTPRPMLEEKTVAPFLKQSGVRTKRENGITYYFILGSWLPFADLMDIAKPFLGRRGESLDFATDRLNPFLTQGYEQLTNESVFFDKTISRFPGERGMFLTQPMNKRAINALRAIPILAELDRFITTAYPEYGNVPSEKGSWWEAIIGVFGPRRFKNEEARSIARYFFNQKRAIGPPPKGLFDIKITPPKLGVITKDKSPRGVLHRWMDLMDEYGPQVRNRQGELVGINTERIQEMIDEIAAKEGKEPPLSFDLKEVLKNLR